MLIYVTKCIFTDIHASYVILSYFPGEKRVLPAILIKINSTYSLTLRSNIFFEWHELNRDFHGNNYIVPHTNIAISRLFVFIFNMADLRRVL